MCSGGFIRERVKRYPRGLENLAHYKASEFEMILILYTPALYGILEEQYMVHMLHLSNAMYLLYQVTVTLEDTEAARKSIERFTRDFDALYNKRYQTSNFHNLLHLTEDVKNAGGLWNGDCFPYENASGLIVKQLHGSCHVPSQLVSALSMVHKLQYIIQECAERNDIQLRYQTSDLILKFFSSFVWLCLMWLL